jgi:uncharacterized membrane protein
MNFIRGFFKGLALQVFTSFLVGIIVAYLNYYDRYIFSSLKSFDDLLSFLLDCLAPAFQTNIIFMVVGFVLIVLAIIKLKTYGNLFFPLGF